MASSASTFASWHNIRHFIDLLAKRSYVPRRATVEVGTKSVLITGCDTGYDL